MSIGDGVKTVVVIVLAAAFIGFLVYAKEHRWFPPGQEECLEETCPDGLVATWEGRRHPSCLCVPGQVP